MMDRIPHHSGAGEEGKCTQCQGERWITYTSELLDGTFEEAREICGCLKDVVTEQADKEERRVLKAYRVFKASGDEIIASYRKGVFWVPSASRPNLKHGVKLARRGQFCSCEDYQVNGNEECWHISCARLVKAESIPCAGCNKRFHRSKLAEVQNEDGFAFSAGDWACRSCLAGSDSEAA